MDVQKERSYAKESNKTKPTGIRFDIEKLELVKHREKLNTNQKVVDFLLNRYWWEYKLPVPTHKEVPPLVLKMEMETKYQQDYRPPPKPRKSPQQWVDEKKELEDPGLYKKWFKELEEDPYLTSKEKTAIKQA